MKMNVIIDIDGTCSNAEHRKYLIDGSQKPKNWDEFYDRCHEDQPHDDIKDLVWMLAKQYFKVHYLTGRVERVRGKTLDWLKNHGFPTGHLEMRPDGDHRMDSIVKAEMAQRLGLTPSNTLLVLDDRDQVVRMWRASGFRCLQVADGAF